MSLMQCGFCSSPLAHPITLWGVEREVCDKCFGFLMRWSNDADPKEPSDEVKNVLAKAASFMKHRNYCRAGISDNGECSCGMDETIDKVEKIQPTAKRGVLA